MKKLFFGLVLLAIPLLCLSAERHPFLDPANRKALFPEDAGAWRAKDGTRSEPAGNTELPALSQWESTGKHQITLKYRKTPPNRGEAEFQSMHDEMVGSLRNAQTQIIAQSQALLLVAAKDTSFSSSLNLLYATPEAVYVWKYELPDTYTLKTDEYLGNLARIVRQHQYNEVMKQDTLIIGQWQPVIHAYARLLAGTASPTTEYVYKNVLRANSSDYEAHGEFIAITKNKTEAAQSAEIIAKNAEDQKLLDLAAKTLGKRAPSLSDFPLLSAADNGFKVILVPLEPCNPWLLADIAKKYEEITKIPVVIRRLPVEWKAPEAARSSYRPQLEQISANIWKDNSDYKNWPLPKLKSELAQAAKKEGPQATAFIDQIFSNMEASGNQYDGVPMVERLSVIVANHIPSDPHTMVVGITGLDIFMGDSNFVFSVHGGLYASPASVLSYARMMPLLGENQSRKRLIERAAKGLVPASLKRLDIPASIDPSCPYSNGDGVQRLDEKTLVLSSPVVQRLDAIRQARQPRK